MKTSAKREEDCKILKNSADYYRAMALAANNAGLMGSYMSNFFIKHAEYEQCLKAIPTKEEEKKTPTLK